MGKISAIIFNKTFNIVRLLTSLHLLLIGLIVMAQNQILRKISQIFKTVALEIAKCDKYSPQWSCCVVTGLS